MWKLNQALFRVMMKRQGKKTLNFALGLGLYNLLLIGVFPSLSRSKGLAEISNNLPKIGRIFGVTSSKGLARFESYVSSQCFGQVWLLVMGIYAINSADELIAQLVDDGAMAYLLSSPAGRLEVLSTQVTVLVSGLAVMLVLTELGIWGEIKLFDIEMDRWPNIPLGILGFALYSAIGAYSLFLSALFNDHEYVLLATSSITFILYALDILSGLDERFVNLKNFTIFGWFRPQEIIEGGMPANKTRSLLGLSAIFLVLAGYVFARKDILV